jgi:hypothetical protein
MTDAQSASLSWNKTPILGWRLDFCYCQTVAGMLMWGALSDERTGLSFTIAACPRQHSGTRDRNLLSQIRVFPFGRLLRLSGLGGIRPRLHTGYTDWTQSQSYGRTDVQSASLSWNKAPIWGLRPDLNYCWTVAGLLMWGALSDERTRLSFARLSRL